MSNVKVKFLAMSRVNLKMGVSSVYRAFECKMSSVGLNFECRCPANLGLNVVCQMKKWANVACRNKAFIGPIKVRR